MVYARSLVAGIAAVLMASVLAILGGGLYMYIGSRSIEDGAIGWDPTSLKRPLIWIVAVLIFAAGFLWEFRRGGR
jgi:hypothetical protein